jgi:hypothetical protein
MNILGEKMSEIIMIRDDPKSEKTAIKLNGVTLKIETDTGIRTSLLEETFYKY